MTTFLKEVKAKISKEINPEALNIIDNSSSFRETLNKINHLIGQIK